MNMKKMSLFTLLLILLTINSTGFAYEVIPSGEAVGIAIKTKGVLITGTSKLTDENGHTVNPAQEADLKKGDRIIAVDGSQLTDNEELAEYVSNRSQDIVLTVERKNKTLNRIIKPVKTTTGYKLGLWVRDSTAGIGTITFIDPHTGNYFGLGHGISDIDTNDILPICDGNILKCEITEPTPGKRGEPGELNGIFYNTVLGNIEQNSQYGIVGQTQLNPSARPVEIATTDEVVQGDAHILANVDGGGIKPYKISINKISENDINGKNMVIEIKDSALTNITGGIVQGMSGAPILQNNKLIGAVTHVFVDNPKKGYGIFAEKMLEQVN